MAAKMPSASGIDLLQMASPSSLIYSFLKLSSDFWFRHLSNPPFRSQIPKHYLLLLLFIITILGADVIQPAFIVNRSAVLVWNCPRFSHLVPLTVLRSIAEALETEFLGNAPVVFDRYVCHTSPFAGEALSFQERLSSIRQPHQS